MVNARLCETERVVFFFLQACEMFSERRLDSLIRAQDLVESYENELECACTEALYN